MTSHGPLVASAAAAATATTTADAANVTDALGRSPSLDAPRTHAQPFSRRHAGREPVTGSGWSVPLSRQHQHPHPHPHPHAYGAKATSGASLPAAQWIEDASSGFNSHHDSTGAVAAPDGAAPQVAPALEDPDMPGHARRATDGGGRAGAAAAHATWWAPLSPGAPRDMATACQSLMRSGAVSSASMATTAHSGPAALAGQTASPVMMGWGTARSEMGFASPSSTSLVSVSRAMTVAGQSSNSVAPVDHGGAMFITAPVTAAAARAFHDEAAGHSESFFDPHAPAPFLTPEPAVDPFLAQDAPMLHMACMTAFPHDFAAVAAGPSLSAALAFNAPRSSSFPATPLVSGPLPPTTDRHAHAHEYFPVSLACCPVSSASSASSEHVHMHVHVPPPPAPPSPWMMRGDVTTVTLPLTAPMTPVTPTTPTAALLSPTTANTTAWTAAVRAAELAYHSELERQLRRHNLGMRVGALPGVSGAVLATLPDAIENEGVTPRDQASVRPAVKPDPDHDLAKTLTAAEHAEQQLHGFPVQAPAGAWPLHSLPSPPTGTLAPPHPNSAPGTSMNAAAAAAAATPLIATSRTAPMTDFICPVCQKRFVRSFNLKSHMKTHSPDRPYACSWALCGKTFARRHDARRHFKTHTAVSLQRPYACPAPACTRRFAKEDALSKHIVESPVCAAAVRQLRAMAAEVQRASVGVGVNVAVGDQRRGDASMGRDE
ncbi:hypothetical protein GGF32_005056 [Allomyces javanicus]|nr:hypothetical protein GGF32_005056 [Allomyces javanicus]